MNVTRHHVGAALVVAFIGFYGVLLPAIVNGGTCP